MKFVDYVKINVRSGDGGPGCCSFRREKFIPRGGPDGGNGGDGGNVIVRGTANESTLLDFQFRQHIKAARGGNGMGKDRHGRKGQDAELEVPLGTLIRDAETGELLAEITDEEPVVLFHGGRGGRGNASFKTSTNQAPREVQPGEPGEERWVALELKLMADVGLVGLPNAGKSTLISRISRAHPKIADYPFTTLTPNLGVVREEGFNSFVVADIPGIIRGAHDGAGLGHRFLRHIERTVLLLLLVDVSEMADTPPMEQYRILVEEMGAYGAALLEKPRALALTKLDLCGGQAPAEVLAELQALEPHVFPISAATGQGLRELLRYLGPAVRDYRAATTTHSSTHDAAATPRS